MSTSNIQFAQSSTAVGRNSGLSWATWRGALIAIGLSMHLASFFLWAVGDFVIKASPLRGYYCADFALFYPFGDGRWLLDKKPIEYFSLLGSGLINPMFLTTFFLQLFKGRPLAIHVLRNLTIFMMPLCWVVFRYEHFYPREGYILWVVGLLLTLFAMSGLRPQLLKERLA